MAVLAEAGIEVVGENRAQDLQAKHAVYGPRFRWHFIGHLQTNKAKVVARHAHLVHTIDTAVLARELGRRVAREGRGPMPVLIEVNVGGEPQKAGAAPADIAEVVAAVRAEGALALRGLMTMPPAGDAAAARRVFETLVSLRNLHGGAALLPELSMGMSDDLEVAVACGATIVRVGTAVFGPRSA